ncbi:phage tail protein [Dyadobacter psychrotolerans]|uniref:Phage tail protein n=1 Tax=Dyadobacter psychrotolerans TaxID=2541721 RepID=A0A4R5DDB9_9BACT|nr:phage tail protein [Dyadobacter psychrotolerans]TDE09980.1 phage tail protein [Dyadobacter psychrotolerans]
MNQFGLIGEGITDQIVIENLLIASFSDPDILVTYLQPLRDATNDSMALSAGNWHKVLEYCGSENFKDSFQSLDYIIIQIDSDVFLSGEVQEKYRNIINSSDSCEVIVDKMKGIIIGAIGEDFYNGVIERIIFAICVHSIECWLLPIYYPTQNAIARKITGCREKLNQILPQKEGFYIHEKKPKYYRDISKKYFKMRPNDLQGLRK